MPDDENIEGSNPYERLAESDRTWDHILNSDPYRCWDRLLKMFSSMDAEEVERQYEAFKKARMQAEELGKTGDSESKNAADDIHEFLLLCEKAAEREL